MDGFDHLLNWKLKQGSHPFPGKEGGTCINEAALVAAGFHYRPIRTADDMPDCFSRPICQFAMVLNDNATEVQRQKLLPFVTRLACADSPEVERQRAAYIRSRTIRWVPFGEGVSILEGALAIGRQAGDLAPDMVQARLRSVQGRAAIAASVPDNPVMQKIKSWFGGSKQVEPAA